MHFELNMAASKCDPSSAFTLCNAVNSIICDRVHVYHYVFVCDRVSADQSDTLDNASRLHTCCMQS